MVRSRRGPKSRKKGALKPTKAKPELSGLSIRFALDEIPNEEIEQQRRISAALERMVGRPLAPAGFIDTPDGPVPMFEGPPKFDKLAEQPAYKDLRASMLRMEKLEKAADGLIQALEALEGREIDGLNSHCREMVDIELGLNIISAAAMHGAAGAALVGSQMMKFGSESLHSSFAERIKENYPEGPGRKPDLYAYDVADKLAGYYIRYRLEKPTYGTNENYPSTDFSRALEKIYDILGIKADIRGPAEAAIGKISDQDIIDLRERKSALDRREPSFKS